MTEEPVHQTGHVVFVVDRREAGVVVLVDDSGKVAEIDATSLPAECRTEGAVLRVPLDSTSVPIWGRATRDKAEEKRRLQLNADRLDRLRRKDPGGDVSL